MQVYKKTMDQHGSHADPLSLPESRQGGGLGRQVWGQGPGEKYYAIYTIIPLFDPVLFFLLSKYKTDILFKSYSNVFRRGYDPKLTHNACFL